MKLLDGKEHILIPYKGWRIKNEDGQLLPDSLIYAYEEPFMRTDNIEELAKSETISNKHTTYNLLDKHGRPILSKCVRKITYYPKYQYYLIEDNNEDDLPLINGGFNANDYWEKSNIVTCKGSLLYEEWFDNVGEFVNGYYHVIRNRKQNLVNLSGRFLLENDADYVSDYNGTFALCCRNNAIYKVNLNGDEEFIKQLPEYDPNKFTHSRCFAFPLDRIGTNDSDTPKYNYSVLNKYLLFDHCYDMIMASGIRGVFFAINNDNCQLIDISSRVLTNYNFKYLNRFEGNLACVQIDGKYGLIDSNGNIIHQGYTSAMYAEHEIWGVNLYSNGNKFHYYCGQGDDYIFFAHEFLLNNKIVGLFEKDNIWYYPDHDNNMIALFEYNPL